MSEMYTQMYKAKKTLVFASLTGKLLYIDLGSKILQKSSKPLESFSGLLRACLYTLKPCQKRLKNETPKSVKSFTSASFCAKKAFSARK